MPGLAKTLLIRSLADALDLSFSRVQFTPDLMPGDITGDRGSSRRTPRRAGGSFRFVEGPLFANVVLADEINRDAAQDAGRPFSRRCRRATSTAQGTSLALPKPFFVLATQNPIEQEGTYPLPEAQLDPASCSRSCSITRRFADEVAIVQRTTGAPPRAVTSVLTGEDLGAYQQLVRNAPVADSVVEHAVRLAARTRPRDATGAPDFVTEYLSYGAGPRASQYLVLAAKALALLDGRLTPLTGRRRTGPPGPVLRHRIVDQLHRRGRGASRPRT